MSDPERSESLDDVLVEIRAESGPASDGEAAWAYSVLGLDPWTPTTS